MTMATFLAVARGEHPADLVLRGARIANVFTLEYEEAEVALWKGRIAGVGKDARGVEEGFGGDAAAVQTGAAEGGGEIDQRGR